MYSLEMQRAHHALRHHKPKGLKYDIIDADNFIQISIDPVGLYKMSLEEKHASMAYLNLLKDGFEQHGAIVMVTRQPMEEDKIRVQRP
jgi:hypothetical protein